VFKKTDSSKEELHP